MTSRTDVIGSRALAAVLAAGYGVPDRVRVHAWLVDAPAQLRQRRPGARPPVPGRRAAAGRTRAAQAPVRPGAELARAALRRDPELAHAHRCLLAPALGRDQLPAPQGVPEQAAILAVEPLTEREREVLRQVSGMLDHR